MTSFIYDSVFKKLIASKSKTDDKNCNKNETKNVKTTEKIVKQACVVLTFGPEKHECKLTLEKLIDNFTYFKRKNSIHVLQEQTSCLTFPHISMDSFKILLKLVIEGKLNNF